MKRFQVHNVDTNKVVFESNDHMECAIKLKEYEKESEDNFEIIDTQKK